ncbi:CreA family protein [Robiginitomaculum antarcticum]|uniref:CreA family protein n=1 Tax=Robiginitomaculum antarcticum TaxID=437507 RepID=UPI000367D3C4|nr:CreA family protein [Robiginitomaculum antarcticum]
MSKLSAALTALTAIALTACGGPGDREVAEINNDWTGNEIKIESFEDDKVKGVVCHMAHFDRSVIDRLSKGSWFENPSNGSIDCGIIGPVTMGDIKRGKGGEEVFRQRQSIIFKKLAVRRVYDEENNALVYLVYSRKIVDGSAKMSIATVSLHGAQMVDRVEMPQ